MKTLPVITMCLLLVGGIDVAAQDFDYKQYLFGDPSTLSAQIVALDLDSGIVEINGADSSQPSLPFTWDWGDGSVTSGWFPQVHTYSDTNQNYVVTVTSNYIPDGHDSVDVGVRFIAPSITPIPVPSKTAVFIPDTPVTLGTHWYSPPTSLLAFDDSYFSLTPRATLEYVLSVAAMVMNEFVNDNTYLFENEFEQFVLRGDGTYSLWFTNPASFSAVDYNITQLTFSSLFHEMGHNFTLNTPGHYHFGGRIDGRANAIFSESMAQIFAHAAGYEIVNNYDAYGLDEGLMLAIRQDIVSTVKFLRMEYDEYIRQGRPFESWNNPNTPEDETFLTFMTVGYKFCALAEGADKGFRRPVMRMMRLLQGFNEDWRQRYDQGNDTAEAEEFRSTLIVAAMSYAFEQDLRDEFRSLNFPVSDVVYAELMSSVRPAYGDLNGDGKSDILWRHSSSGQNWLYIMNGTGIGSSEEVNKVNPSWTIVGNGDYNGDGKSDIFWRNSSTGQNWMYLMDGSTVVSSAGVNTVPDSNWRVVSDGDFNGDGKADILWRHKITGQVWLYTMDGRSISDSAGVVSVNPTWKIAASGDYNGDGNADILWRNSSTGQNWMYLMDGTTILSSISVNKVSDLNWQIVGSGDYDGDGKADILWRHAVSGQNWLYFMDGSTIVSSVGINTVPDSNWQVVGTGDYDGDGKSDILWRNSLTGQNWMYLMDGSTIVNSIGVNTVSDVTWQVVYTAANPSALIWDEGNWGEEDWN